MTIDTALGTATGQGADTFDGPTNFVGSAFDDTLIWDAGTVNTFVGGDGVDLVDASALTSGQNINLDTLDDGVFPLGPVTADSLENATGGSGNDTLTGNDVRNLLTGGDGDDLLDGAAGNDTLLGEGGNDTYTGGTGADRVSFANSPQGVNVDLSLGFATGEGDDSFGDGVEIIVGSAFNDDVTGGPFGGGGTVNFLFVGKGGNDSLTGFSGNDTLQGRRRQRRAPWRRRRRHPQGRGRQRPPLRWWRHRHRQGWQGQRHLQQGRDQDELREEGQPRISADLGRGPSELRDDPSSEGTKGPAPEKGAGPVSPFVVRRTGNRINPPSVD